MVAGPFRFRLPVRFADVDHAGIVYYPNFFHYFHQAFEEVFRDRLGPPGYKVILDRDRIGLPVVRAEADFRRPLAYGDEVTVEVSLAALGEKSVTLRYRALAPAASEAATTVSAAASASATEPETVVAEAHVTCATIDMDTFKAIPVPAALRRIFAELAPASGGRK
jgi:4-hydroxybenzoyl-CoA thioesterase